ncbi:MAG: benzoate transporter [Raineya sp.]
MTYDCFAFFNELDLLRLRLHELSEVVDKFVLVEATRTFQKKPKPLYFQENKHLFKQFEHKIIHIVVDKYPTFWTKFRIPTAWDYDNHQKEQILQGLKDCKPDDVVIVSDLDEIPDAQKVRKYAHQQGIKVFRQYQSYYFLNNVCRSIHDFDGKALAQINQDGYGFWQGSVMLFFKDIQTIKQTRLYRDNSENERIKIIHEGGWHFSYMGGIERIIEKVESWTHPEYNTEENKNPERIKKIIREGKSLFYPDEKYELVDINNTLLPFPKYLKENIASFKHLILQP